MSNVPKCQPPRIEARNAGEDGANLPPRCREHQRVALTHIRSEAASVSPAPRWYSLCLVAADGSVRGHRCIGANSTASASCFATMFLAGTSTVRLDEAVSDE